ncbi:MAG TPA: helix-turn-helix transcriptional regulator [Thermoanaerobaculia bacterium]
MPRKFSKDPVGEIFGATVRRLRENKGWTQEQLAEQAEMSATYVGFIERGENVPTLTIILKLADALSVTPAQLIADVTRMR